MGFAADFLRAMDEARRPVLEAALRALSTMSAREFIPRWYVMLFQIIRATEPMLEVARGWAFRDHERIEFNDSLMDFFSRKMDDESGHEEILLDDLARVGVSKTQAKTAAVNPFVAEMVGRQHYLIAHVHPSAYLGYIGLLEGFPPTLEQIDALQAASGFPAEAFSCARLHAKVDIGHREELAKVLDEVPAELRPVILANGLRCAALQCAALEHLTQQENLP